MRLLSVVGTRPQFIKAAGVSRALRAKAGVIEVLVHTGQHYDANMSEFFFDELEIPRPDYNLGIGSASHGVQTGQMLAAIERVAIDEKPDWMLVYGDTNSTLAGALAAAKLHLPVAHVEAGLRSFNRRMPEEINRVVADHLSALLFAPTQVAVDQLRKEGMQPEKIYLVGDVMYDVALYYAEKAQEQNHRWVELGLKAKQYVLATIHRAENTDSADRLRAIVDGLAGVARDVPVVLPLHPRTRKALQREGLMQGVSSRLRVLDPVGYLDMVLLEKNASLIATDSGGVQKEAFFYRVPCVTIRDETEWVELVEAGANKLCPPRSGERIGEMIRAGLRNGFPADAALDLYGDGAAAAQIATIVAGSDCDQDRVYCEP